MDKSIGMIYQKNFNSKSIIKRLRDIPLPFTFTLLPFIFYLLPFILISQDLHLSQYESSPQYLNPAMTGMFDGDYRIIAHHRSQWRTIATKPFNSSLVSLDLPYKKIKTGVFILNNRAGAGNYNVLNVVFSAAADYAIKKAPDHHLSGGLQAGIIHKSINMDKLYFSTQYNSNNGGSFNTDLSSGENFSNASIILPEINAGFLYYYANAGKRMNPFIGAAVFHLTEPNETFFGVLNKLPRRYVLHGGLKLNLSEKLYLLYHSLAMQQTNDREVVNTLLLNYYLQNSDIFLLLGSTYRNKDAVIAHAGLKYGNFTYRLSYDINTSTLNAISNGKGGIELSVAYIMKKPIPNPVVTCPRL